MLIFCMPVKISHNLYLEKVWMIKNIPVAYVLIQFWNRDKISIACLLIDDNNFKAYFCAICP